MTEHPILFSAPMVRAILDGAKTQTRRAIKPQPVWLPAKAGAMCSPGWSWRCGSAEFNYWPDAFGFGTAIAKHCPLGQAGDHLWVRETWQTHCDQDGITPRDLSPASAVQYPATYDHWVSKKRPSIHMPRWASRITLEVTDVRAERLQDITETDAALEGAVRMAMDDESRFFADDRGTFKCGFAGIWAHINGSGSWDANPWVWAISFKRIETQRAAA
jgi:hypothetical protein